MMLFWKNLGCLLLIASASAFVANRPALGSRTHTSLSMSAALIVQNKGGGHGELGYRLAKNLSSNDKITSITILQDDACNFDKEPFKSYASDLPDVRVVTASLSSDDAASTTSADLQKILGEGEKYEYVWDNCSKAPECAGKAICDLAKEWGVKLYTYVSSAGMYKPTDEFPMPETTPNKDSGQALLERYALEIGLPFVTFRPQYIYGEKSNKWDYIDWYFDRIVRKVPLPIPQPGTQKVSLTNSVDVASILASPLNNEEAAIKQCYFNCGTDQLLTYDEVAYMCAEAAGVSKDDVDIVHYDPELGKAKFPFRLTDFYVAPDKAKAELGWPGSSKSLKDDLKWYAESYNGRGGPTKELDLAKDQEVLA